MQQLRTILPALALAFTMSGSPGVSAHSVEDLESMLGDREKYFQPLDQEAPGFALQTAEEKTVGLADLPGKVAVLHFIYAGCPDVCPLHAERIAEVQEMINRTPMKAQVQFVTVTTDPVNDTGGVLRDYGPAHGLDPANWVFLTTAADQPEDATRRLAEAYGHKFSKTEDGYQVHGVVTHVIGKRGRWRGNFHGLKFQPANLVVFVNALVNDAAAPHAHPEQSWWDQFMAWF
ncbi:MAG: redoxin domain-containing protein [Kiloniellaceae bacterium]|nr:redoxin domain-containing protein [Kiloniellaceae bacterium]